MRTPGGQRPICARGLVCFRVGPSPRSYSRRRAMKSAHGHVVPPEDVALTHVEAGSPMGELLRRYWQPVALSDELCDLPQRVRVLGGDLVVFRTNAGKTGCLTPHCAHRGTSLEFGSIEETGIRFGYHGWLSDTEGRVLE